MRVLTIRDRLTSAKADLAILAVSKHLANSSSCSQDSKSVQNTRLSSTHIRVEYDNPGNEGDELPVRSRTARTSYPRHQRSSLRSPLTSFPTSRGTNEPEPPPRNRAQQLSSKRAVFRTGPADAVIKTPANKESFRRVRLSMTSHATTQYTGLIPSHCPS
ncbi:hypothetical protein BDP81DRAFT_418887 [Colletotrichum phormii]|uniref:Uncharacterized protein n=1 Tax=Colletotrichum phormii TaxID=359342 RepID=A0AAJ0EIB9_9PEZI|nr:uncharacterized protein BDP81DRAFT_418887 [Colletotrichum phormii]KAK1641422.1 hypothetical protein BDP81DRAFT_418887 [Colletotrichum phormii]